MKKIVELEVIENCEEFDFKATLKSDLGFWLFSKVDSAYDSEKKELHLLIYSNKLASFIATVYGEKFIQFWHKIMKLCLEEFKKLIKQEGLVKTN